MQSPHITFEPTSLEDGEQLVTLRIAAMRPSLEHIGRFDPVRARERFLSTFDPQQTQHIVCDGQRVGFLVVKTLADHVLLDHFYIDPAHQSRGIGAPVLAHVFSDADAKQLPVRVGALKESASNQFYLRQGFVLVEQADWDNYYMRMPVKADSH
jgi:GNAT superfamily N-acetyltransferase